MEEVEALSRRRRSSLFSQRDSTRRGRDRNRRRRTRYRSQSPSASVDEIYRHRRRHSSHEEDNEEKRRSSRRRRHRRQSPRRKYDDNLDRSSKRRRRQNRSERESPSRSPARKRRRKERRRRTHARWSTSPEESSPSSSLARVAVSAARRAGVVSDDDDAAAAVDNSSLMKSSNENNRTARRNNGGPPKRRDSSAGSAHDDTVGHFKGGRGTMIASRYRVLHDVGLGTFGRVVECVDIKRAQRSQERRRDHEDCRVAIKIVRDVKRYYDSARIEADIVEEVNRRGGRGRSLCAILYDAFTWKSHYCMVFESLGPSLFDFMKRHNYQPFPMMCIRDFAQQLLEALEFLHSFGLIHTDLKPENILLTNYREVSYKSHGKTFQIPESSRIKIIDFGGATYDDEKKSSVVNTRQYRAPEVILGLGWSKPSDLWSAGCILAELYHGELLFATHDNLEHLALMEKRLGSFPRRILKLAKNSPLASQAFDSSGRHRMERVLPPESASYVHNTGSIESLVRREDDRFLDLLRRMLVIDPDPRATAHECLRYRL